ncbi:MAG TPA: hypothetical protein VGY77_05285 [Gemmataceae bacterium]|nr:hypothetical protein [Gemmataceae bacterium]
MKTILHFLFIWALAALFAGLVPADSPKTPANAGQILVLRNERIIQGQIEMEGKQYRIRRQVGETWVPADQVLFLCNSMEEAYHFLRGRANLRDVDERMRLAKWCHLHGLRKEAVAEATAAVELRPQSIAALRLLQTLQRTADTAEAKVISSVKMESSADRETTPKALPPSLEASAETMGQFIRRVQPVLMNTCASCHMSGRAGAFKLVRAYDGGMVSRKATQENLTAVLTQINREKWEVSPFLVKAVSLHGNTGQPPLKGRQSPAFKSLEEWVRATLAENPQFHSPASSGPLEGAAASISKSPEEGDNLEPPISSDPPNPPRKISSFGAEAPVSPKKSRATPGEPVTEPKPAKPVDPFDPVIFNQQRNPKKN